MTSQEFAGMLNSNQQPWKGIWSDSSKEQYFSMLNAEQANEHELEMWRLNNEYNSPRAQMERMIEAGINPAAAYQQISSGNASSSPGTHMSSTPAWHDQADKLARINTIIGGIRDIMSTVSSGVNAVQGLQDVALRHQNNWYDKLRADYVNLNGFSPWLGSEKSSFTHPVQVSPGLYADAVQMQLFPEFYQALKESWKGGNYDIQSAARADQHSLVERRNRIDGLVQRIFKGFDNNMSAHDLLKLFLELMAYTSIQNFGGGF